jgi:cytosine/adenosine deaminase-related metal-dependent hydrolase
MEGEIGTIEAGRRADLLVVDGDPSRDVTILQDQRRIVHVISRGELVDRETPLPERRIHPSEQVRFLAACPLTQQLALSEADIVELSQV